MAQLSAINSFGGSGFLTAIRSRLQLNILSRCFESLHTVIAFAVQNNLHLHQIDFTSAFLNSNLKEEVYMKQPEYFVKKQKEHLVCKLNSPLGAGIRC